MPAKFKSRYLWHDALNMPPIENMAEVDRWFRDHKIWVALGCPDDFERPSEPILSPSPTGDTV